MRHNADKHGAGVVFFEGNRGDEVNLGVGMAGGGGLKAKADLLPHPPPRPPPHHHQSWMTRGLRLGLRWRQRQS